MKFKYLKHIIISILFLAVSVLLFLTAIVKYDIETDNNTYSIDCILENASYERDRGAHYLFFMVGDAEYYCSGNEEQLKAIKELADQNANFRLTVTDERSFSPFYLFPYKQVIEVEYQGEMLITAENHNKDQVITRWIYIAVSILTFIWFALYTFFFVILQISPRKKRKKRKS